jgi:hypothetical protein
MIMRDNIFTCVLILGCLGVTIGLFHDRAVSPALPPPISVIAANDEPIQFVSAPPFPEEFILSKRIKDVRVSQMPTLEDALAAIANAVHCDLQVKWAVLQQVGVQRTTPIQLNEPLAGLSAEAAIHHIFSEVPGPVAIDYIVKGHTIIVSTEVDLSGEVVTLAYDIRGLIQAYIQAMQVPGAAGPSMSRMESVDEITNAVMSDVEADTWRTTGETLAVVANSWGFCSSPRHAKTKTRSPNFLVPCNRSLAASVHCRSALDLRARTGPNR